MRRTAPTLAAILLAAAALLPAGAFAGEAAHPARALVEQAQLAAYREPAQAPILAARALQMLVAQPDVELEALARLVLCDHHAERDVAAAEREIARLDELVARGHRPGLRAGVQSCRGALREYAGDTAGARALYEEAVALADGANDRDMLANALFLRGYARALQGELASGLTDLRRAHGLYLGSNQTQRTANVLNAIAIVYNRMGDHALARDYYQQTLRSQEALGALREQAVTHHNLGRAVENLGEIDAARTHYERALELSGRIDFARGSAYALRGLASLANRAGDGQAALALLQKAEKAAGLANDQRLQAQLLLQRGIAQRLLNRPADAVASLQQALRIFASADSRVEMAQAFAALAQAHAAGGDWKSAYEREQSHARETERLMRMQLDQRFATLKVEFDTAAKDRENAALQREMKSTEQALAQEQRANRLQVVVIALACVLLLVFALLALRAHRARVALSQLALTDELTGLPNRRAVLSRLQSLLERPATRRCAVLLADLDHFKRINDEHGHLAGDEVLKLAASRLTLAVREPAFVGRLGGEEFLVVLPDCDLEAARQVAERIRQDIADLGAQRREAGAARREQMPPLTVSLGVAAAEPGGDSVSGMLRRADAALYDAKRAGRNRVIALVAPTAAA